MAKTKSTKENIADQIKAMEQKLTEAAAQLPSEKLIVPYDNGGGQSGVRENPFYAAYEKLMVCYLKTVGVANDLAVEGVEEVSSIDDLRSRFKIAK